MAITRLALVASMLLMFSACSEELSGPTPSAESIAPAIACNAQLTTEITLQGAKLAPLALDAADDDPKLALPDIELLRITDLAGTAVNGDSIRLDNDPADPMGARVTWENTTTMHFQVDPELALEPGVYEVTVTNHNGKSATLEAKLTLVPEPVIGTVDPDLVCNAEGERSVTLTGENFVTVDGVMPTVRIGADNRVVTAAENCTAVEAAALPVSLCTTLIVALPQNSESPGVLEVQVTNPTPAECTSETVDMGLVPEPTVATADPDLFCTTDGSVSMTVTGTGFLDIDGDLPTILFDTVEIQAVAIDGCTDVEGTTLGTRSCTSLTVEVGTGVVPDGAHGVFVRNPLPAGCTSNETVSALISGPPVLVVPGVSPLVCSLDLPRNVTVDGSNLLRVANAGGGFTEPELLLKLILATGTISFVPTIASMGGCVPLTGTTTAGEICTSVSFSLPDTLGAGSYEVTVTNPPPASCATSVINAFRISDPPLISTAAPSPLCSAGDTFLVGGTDFVAGTRILVDGAPISTTVLSGSLLRGFIAPGFAPGTYDVSAVNSGNCVSNVLDDQITVSDVPTVFFADPANNLTGTETRLTVWVSGINDTPTVSVRLTGTTDAPTPLLNPVFNGSDRILTTLPVSLATGDYDVLVDDSPCPVELINALHIIDTPTVHVSGMTPDFGANDVGTSIVIRSDDPTPVGEVNFAITPRAYLAPQAGGEALEIQSVSFVSINELSGVVPPGLSEGTYDLVVVNPDGQIGILAGAFRALPDTDPPPDVSALSPSQVSDGALVDVSVLGSFFPTILADVDVAADCMDPSNPGAGVVSPSATVLLSSFSQVDTQWDMTGLAGFVCLVRVTNLANQTSTEFSALAVTNAPGTVNTFTAGADMLAPRRALGAAVLRSGDLSRRLFAIGGDGGDDGVSNPVRLASVESALLDGFGIPGSFDFQRNSLPDVRSFVGVTSIERFIYAIGGRVGAGAGSVSNSVLRAYLLDPAEAPRVEDVALEPATAGGLPGGTFTYRVAALMPAGDDNNPNGEGLPSEPFVVELPALADGIEMTLFWSSVPGADRYRIYRSPTPGLALGNEAFLAEVPHVNGPAQQSFFDDNSIDNSAETETPMPPGSLGVWHSVGTLATAREGAAVVAVPDPVNADVHYIYVFGGRNAGGAVLNSYEYMDVTASASSVQIVSPTFTGSQTLDDSRWLAGAVYLDETRSSELQPNTAWVYVLKGEDGAGGVVDAISLYQVDTANGGELINEHAVATGGVFGGGYGYCAGNNAVFVFGGGGAPSSQGRSGPLLEADCAVPGPTCFPDLTLSAGFTMSVARFLHGSILEGPFIYLLGGQTTAPDAQASASTERSNL